MFKCVQIIQSLKLNHKESLWYSVFLSKTGSRIGDSDFLFIANFYLLVFSGEAISKKLFEVLKDFMKELNTDTSRIMKFNNYDEAAAVSIYSTKNKRKKMEDRHICYQDLNNLFNMKVNFFFLLYLLLGRPTANFGALLREQPHQIILITALLILVLT